LIVPTARPIEELLCWTCSQPQGAEVRHPLAQTGELSEAQRSPATGLPLSCCRIRSMAIVSSNDENVPFR
jgi:hypothetical protein